MVVNELDVFDGHLNRMDRRLFWILTVLVMILVALLGTIATILGT